MDPSAVRNPTDLLASAITLPDLLDASNVEDVLRSFYALFRIAIRILDESGSTLARTRKQPELNEFLREHAGAAPRLDEEHAALRSSDLGAGGELVHTAFTGARYHIVAIGHDGRRVGRFIVGPFLLPEMSEMPPELSACEPRSHLPRLRELWNALPRVRPDTVRAIARHLSVTLDALIYAGYRAKLSEHMHLASVCESERQLEAAQRHQSALERGLAERERLPLALLASISAELATPLRFIATQSENLATSPRLSGADREVTTNLHHHAARLSSLAQRWRSLSELGSTASALHMQEVEPAALLEGARSALRATAREPGRINVTCEGGLPAIWADSARMIDVLCILGESARDFASDEPLDLEARRNGAVAEEAEASVLLGSPAPLLEFRVSSPRRGVLGGRLGVNLVRHLVDAHAGQVRAEERSGSGSVFVVSVPVRQAR